MSKIDPENGASLLIFCLLFKMFRSFNTVNIRSLGQKASKLLVGDLKKKSATQPQPHLNGLARGPRSRTPGVKSFSKFDGW